MILAGTYSGEDSQFRKDVGVLKKDEGENGTQSCYCWHRYWPLSVPKRITNGAISPLNLSPKISSEYFACKNIDTTDDRKFGNYPTVIDSFKAIYKLPVVVG